jgi:hypothetical protein
MYDAVKCKVKNRSFFNSDILLPPILYRILVVLSIYTENINGIITLDVTPPGL